MWQMGGKLLQSDFDWRTLVLFERFATRSQRLASVIGNDVILP